MSDINDKYSFERFASIIRYTNFEFLQRDPSWIIYIADTNGQFNLWRQRCGINSELGLFAPHQLTAFVDNAVAVAFSSPVDDTIIFFADRHGSENFQIYSIDAFSGSSSSITDNPEVRHEWGEECLSHDGRYITYSSNERNSSDMLIYVKSMGLDDTRCITEQPGWYIPGYWSPDNRWMNCSQLVTMTDYTIWLLDIEKSEMTKITPTNEKSRYTPGPWSPDGRGFYVGTDLNHEYVGLALYDIYDSKFQWVLTPNWDVEAIDLDRCGKVLAWSINEDGYSKLFTKDLETDTILQEDVPEGVINNLTLSPDGSRMGFLMSTPTSPPNIYIMDLKTHKLNRHTNSLMDNIPDTIMVQPNSIRYKSFDDLDIPALLYTPEGSENKLSGVILSIHGGPMGQERPTYAYSGLYQYLANRGLAVLAPNFRGSTGYGKSFERKIYHDWGGNELKDLEYAIRWLLEQDWVDSSRLGVFGGSFGGFATLSCITRLEKYNWRAAVDIMGPSNLLTFIKSVPAHWQRFMGELVGDPETEKEFLEERSPITYVNDVLVDDILIIQGVNDPRVVKAESDQIAERLARLGRNIEYIVFDDEGHGFNKYSNMMRALKSSAEFLERKLRLG